MRAFGHVLLFVENLHGEGNPGAVDLNDLDLGAHDESDGYRVAMLEVYVGAHGELLGGEHGAHTVHGRFFNELNELRRRENIGPLVAGLLRGHPLFDAGLAAIGPSDLEFRTHCPGRIPRGGPRSRLRRL